MDAPNPRQHPVPTASPRLLERLKETVEESPLGGCSAAHLHLFTFDSLAPLHGVLSALLNQPERQQAARFRFTVDARRYERGRGLLRWLLGAYLGIPADELFFEYQEFGRPALRGRGIEFNVSHTRRYLALAFARAGAIGVDVEGERGSTELLGIARRFFAAGEYARLASMPQDRRSRAFLRCWTQKEAYIKALGAGLSMPLDRFEVGVLPEEPCGLRAAHDDPAEIRRWSFFEYDALEEAHVALAIEGEGRAVRAWWWGDPTEPSIIVPRADDP